MAWSFENEIDRMEEQLPLPQHFILPGGAIAGAAFCISRAVARCVKGNWVSLSRLERVAPQILRYLNRLSGLCFVLACYVNQQPTAQGHNPNPKNSSRQ
jgi:cob(I)alamin adenosyltransferase